MAEGSRDANQNPPAGGGGAAEDNQISHNQMDVNECLGSWVTYLQMLNGLCSAGTKLALSLQALLSVHDTMSECRVTSQCLAGWEELTRATNVASNTVKKHVDAAMKDYEVTDDDGEKHDILRDNLLTFINLQYQFCVACCKCLGSMAQCSCSQDGSECDIAALQQCFERLYSSPPPVSPSSSNNHSQQSSHRSPLPYSLFPLQVQRRWSETAAADMAGSECSDQTARRWSMPWDCRHVTEWPRQETTTRLRVPHLSGDRSRSTTPDSVWKSQMTSQDGLREAIQLLSCKPGVKISSQLEGQDVPGVTLTPCSYETIGYDTGMWPDSRHHVGSSRCWPLDSRSSDHSDNSGPRDSDHRDSEHSGESGSVHGDSKDSIHSHSSTDLLSSRKNSSSGDSCISAHSRSGSENGAGESVRSNLYSMWSGCDVPFLRLPDSSEIHDDSN